MVKNKNESLLPDKGKKSTELILIDPSDSDRDKKLIIASKLLQDIEPELSREILSRRSAEAGE